MAFRVGQRVEIVGSFSSERIGTVATVVAGPEPLEFGQGSHWHFLPVGTPMYQVDLPSLVNPANYGWGPEQWLRSLDGGDEPVIWTEELKRLCRTKETADV